MENNKKLSKFSDICMTLIIIMFIVCFGIALFEAIAFNKNILGFNYTPILMIIAAAVFVVLLISSIPLFSCVLFPIFNHKLLTVP